MRQKSLEKKAEEEAGNTGELHSGVRIGSHPVALLRGRSPFRTTSGTRSGSWTHRAKVLKEMLTRRRLLRITCLCPARHSSHSSRVSGSSRDADAIVVAQPAAGMRSLAGEGEQSICSWLLTLMQVSAVEAVRLPVAPGALPATLLL